ncbi:MAG: hypothetical protein JXA57_06285 [Armatimonadetes bacterium]|nr:hypothetical protein [Armatimonadota bacterium]
MGFLLYLVVVVIVVIPFWKIFQKAGFPPAFSLLMLIPVVNLVAIYFVAFASWPSSMRKS